MHIHVLRRFNAEAMAGIAHNDYQYSYPSRNPRTEASTVTEGVCIVIIHVCLMTHPYRRKYESNLAHIIQYCFTSGVLQTDVRPMGTFERARAKSDPLSPHYGPRS